MGNHKTAKYPEVHPFGQIVEKGNIPLSPGLTAPRRYFWTPQRPSINAWTIMEELGSKTAGIAAVIKPSHPDANIVLVFDKAVDEELTARTFFRELGKKFKKFSDEEQQYLIGDETEQLTAAALAVNSQQRMTDQNYR